MNYNFHAHTKFCKHSDIEIEDLVDFAIENNFEHIGISEHLPIG